MNQKNVLITGGTSGLGLALAKQLAKANNVTIVSRSEDKMANALTQLRKINSQCQGYCFDISKIADMKKLADHLKKDGKQIDFLILNAAILHVGSLSETDDMQLMKEVIDVNLWGTLLSAKYLSPLLNEKSKVLFVSSALGLVGIAGYAGYCAAKAGMINFAEVLRRELKHKKVNVYVACPADIDTPQFEYELANMPAWMKSDPGNKMRPKAMQPDRAASLILKQCHGGRFLIYINKDLKMLMLLAKFLPHKISRYLIDSNFPMPKSAVSLGSSGSTDPALI